MNSPLQIRTFTLGNWQTNCYVVWPAEGKSCWIVDAGFNPGAMIAFIRREGLIPEMIVLTHAHVDHIAGLAEVRRAWPDVPIAIHEAERDFLPQPTLNLSAVLDEAVIAPSADRLLQHGETLELTDAGAFEVRHTPGHSPGGICLYHAAAQIAFVGDTLFHNSIGRYDFPTSNGPQLFNSIRDQLLTLPDATRILPGHGPETTLGRERRGNPFLR